MTERSGEWGSGKRIGKYTEEGEEHSCDRGGKGRELALTPTYGANSTPPALRGDVEGRGDI